MFNYNMDMKIFLAMHTTNKDKTTLFESVSFILNADKTRFNVIKFVDKKRNISGRSVNRTIQQTLNICI